MGNEPTPTPSKCDKTSPPPKEQPPIYPYPDWSALQAYYGPGMMPPPYYSAPGHAPQPYMWAPQPIMPPYGAPFMYPHGGAYSHHPAMPLVPQHTSTESPAKSATEKDNKSTMKKHKEVNCFAMSAANDITEKASSEESDVRKNETGVSVVQKRKQSSADEPDPKLNKKGSSWKDGESSGPSKVTSEIGEVTVKPLTTLPPYCSAPGVNPTASAVSNGTIPSSRNAATDLWYKDDKEIKREKRKQSNRESARRSRLRKQAETEELTMKVESLTAENSTLKSEIGRLTQDSEKLKSENSILQEKLKKQASQVVPSSVVVENFLSMIDKNANSSANIEAQDNTNNNSTNGKLHQLLDPARRTDAVAAS